MRWNGMLCLLVSWTAWGQGVPPAPRRLTVDVPGRVDTNVTNEYVAVAGGPAGERLEVSLDTATLDKIATATALGNCTYTDGDPTASVGTTAANVPSVPMANRTAITIWNHSTQPSRQLICSASGPATTSHGLVIYPNGQWWKWQGLGAGVVISCRCATSTCTYGYLEEQCYQ